NVKVQLGLTDNDTDSTSISGAMDAAFGIDFDSGNLRISDFQILDGTLIANNSMQFNLSFFLVSINATTSNIAGTPFSPGPSMLTTAARPGVTGFYSAGDHGLSLNQGIINVSGAVSNQINLA